MVIDAASLILLVDGSGDCRHVYRTILEHVGYPVEEANTGEEGLRLARELRPVLIVTEFPLPVPGYCSLAEAVRADPALLGIRILSVTAHALPCYREQALRAGVNGFVAKPLAPRDLVREVQRFLSPAIISG